MSATVRKKTPKRIVKSRKVRKKTHKKLHPLHPIMLAQVVREEKPPTPLMEFIHSCEGEGVEYLELVREFQSVWCDHPASEQEVSSTMYEPSKERYQYTLKCNCCGILRLRSGRAPSAASR